MTLAFKGWSEVANQLRNLAHGKGMELKDMELNDGQKASLIAMADRISLNGLIVADEVGMGKTRIAVALAKCVIAAGGRVAILVPPGLGFQWSDELRGANINHPPILRSLWQFLQAWESDDQPQPWFQQDAVLISHAFTNWRLGEKGTSWRWALLPELYALWRQSTSNRLPRGYHGPDALKALTDSKVKNAAKNIIAAVNAAPANDHRRILLNELAVKTPWPGALKAVEYGSNAQLRPWLEKAVGLGLGEFDLVIIDEAHKSRDQSSGLNRLLEQVVLQTGNTRRLAMTATPVELDAQQWLQMLKRIQADGESVASAVEKYTEAVRTVRQCPSDASARLEYKHASANFKNALDPYLLRRDKREDPAVLKFQAHSGEGFHAYRREREILVETKNLTNSWKQAICATEALSFVTGHADNAIAKRLRLTLGNGHGVAALIDQIHRHEVDDKKQHEEDGTSASSSPENNTAPLVHDKRLQRAEWWQKVVSMASQSNCSGDEVLYDHPTILAAVTFIEDVCQRGEKVLVFGRFTRPMKALADLLNARAMLRSLDAQQHPWPQAKVPENEWRAILAAHRQLQRSGSLNYDDFNQTLEKQYKQLEAQRRTTRAKLIEHIETGFAQNTEKHPRAQALFNAFKQAAAEQQAAKRESAKHKAAEHQDANKSDVAATAEHEVEIHDDSALAVVARAIQELIDTTNEKICAAEFTQAFVDLMEAATDRDEGDNNGDGDLDSAEAVQLWHSVEERLRNEYNRQEGDFARLMNGSTTPSTRRLLQLAFNRKHGNPKVLVAQSMVGREGLNLHKACRTVILLHPEWNPGVVEQQIGRVDRISSLWAHKLEEAIENKTPSSELPRIEICPVIFQGTYDEWNWQVLRERWDNLRAQLHGVVISPSIASKYGHDSAIIAEINDAAPNFSPLKHSK